MAHWRTLFRRLKARHPGAQVLLIGGAADRPLGRLLGDPAQGRHDLCGVTRLGESAALLQACDAVVGGDTGPLHLACAVGSLCIGLFGPTHPSESGPWATESYCLRANDGCMDSLAPRAVAASLLALLEGEQQPRERLRRHGVECWAGRGYQRARLERAAAAAEGRAWLSAQSIPGQALEILPLAEGLRRRAQGQGRPLHGLDHALIAATECLKVKVLAEELC